MVCFMVFFCACEYGSHNDTVLINDVQAYIDHTGFTADAAAAASTIWPIKCSHETIFIFFFCIAFTNSLLSQYNTFWCRQFLNDTN